MARERHGAVVRAAPQAQRLQMGIPMLLSAHDRWTWKTARRAEGWPCMQKRLVHLMQKGALVIGKGLMPFGESKAMDGVRRHVIWEHPPIWNYVPPRCARPFGPGTKPLYQDVSSASPLHDVLAKTKLLVFAGAELSANLTFAMNAREVPTFVFEPNLKALKAFLEQVDDQAIVANNVYLFCGDFHQFERPLSAYLTDTAFNLGFPVVYATERVTSRYASWLEELTRYVEVLFFRHRIYPVEGQFLSRSLPLRNITRGLSFDQIKHAYENVVAYTRHGRIDELKNAFQGAAALCVGAGPVLDSQIGYVKKAKERGALIIAVNNALRTLLHNGVTPHFVVINDTSVDAAKAFSGIAPTDESVLVAHALSSTGDGTFSRVLFFGNHLEEIFGKRMDLRLHGSVITTAISFSRHLGCKTCVLVGIQLASPSSTLMKYAERSLHGKIGLQNKDAHKNLMCPIRNIFGDTMYATPNFIDAYIWILDEMRSLDMEVVNITRESIVHGHGIKYVSDYSIDSGCDVRSAFDGVKSAPQTVDRDKMLEWMNNEMQFWNMLHGKSSSLLKAEECDDVWLGECGSLIHGLDNIGATYMLHRYKAFNNAIFHKEYYASRSARDQVKAAKYYLSHMRSMSQELAQTLEASFRQVEGVVPGAG